MIKVYTNGIPMTSTNIAAAVAPQVVKVPIWPATSPLTSANQSTSIDEHNPYLLKKQKSLIDSSQSITNLSIMSTRRATFQRQLSVDQVNLSNSVKTWTNSTFNNNLNSSNKNTPSFEKSSLRPAPHILNTIINKKRHQTTIKNE